MRKRALGDSPPALLQLDDAEAQARPVGSRLLLYDLAVAPVRLGVTLPRRLLRKRRALAATRSLAAQSRSQVGSERRDSSRRLFTPATPRAGRGLGTSNGLSLNSALWCPRGSTHRPTVRSPSPGPRGARQDHHTAWGKEDRFVLLGPADAVALVSRAAENLHDLAATRRLACRSMHLQPVTGVRGGHICSPIAGSAASRRRAPPRTATPGSPPASCGGARR